MKRSRQLLQNSNLNPDEIRNSDNEKRMRIFANYLIDRMLEDKAHNRLKFVNKKSNLKILTKNNEK